MTSVLDGPWNSVLSILNADAVDFEARAQAGFEGLCLVIWLLIPIRLAQVVTTSDLLGDFKYTAAVLTACFVYLSKILMQHWWQPAASKGSPSHRQHAWSREQLYFCLGVVVVFSALYHHTSDSVMRDRIFWRNFLPLLFTEASLMHLSRRLYLAVVLPLNLLACALHLYLAGETTVRLVCFVVFLGIMLSYIFTFKHLVWIGLQRAVNESRQACEAAELQRQKADAWQSAFGAMLHGVFDASCVCDAGGAVRSSTPQLDSLLLGGSMCEGDDFPNGLAGAGLLDAAAGAAERQRLADFLADVARPGNMRKLQLSLQPLAKGGRGSRIEVSISGIGLPKEATDSSGGGAPGSQLFLGLQVLESVEPLGAEEVTGPATDEVLHSIREAEVAAAEAAALRPATEVNFCDDAASSVAAPRPRMRRAASCRSAPAVLKRQNDLTLEAGFATSCAGDDGDCLPPDAVVWLEGQSVPVKVGEVSAGQRVLCYDHLAGGLKYSEVIDVATHDATASEWVAVSLEDGTELQMTVDHPVFTKMSEAPIKAGDLEPSTHSLEVMRVVAMPVKEVRHLSRADAASPPPTERVSLSVLQPMRHSVFVASGPRAEGSMAVASASVDVQANSGNQYRVKNTFLDEIPEETGRPRAGSAPPRAWAAEEPAAARSPAPLSRGLRRMPTTRSSRSASTGRASVISYISSAPSRATQPDSPSRRVVVGVDRPADRTLSRAEAQPNIIAEATLSQVLAIKRQGLRSVGSLRHREGKCCPCLMETRHRQTGCSQGQPCRLGLLCGRCHEDHDMKEFSSAQKDLRRKKKSAAAAPARNAEE